MVEILLIGFIAFIVQENISDRKSWERRKTLLKHQLNAT